MSIKFQPAGDADMRFVEDTWLSSFRTANTAGLIAMEDWRSVMLPQIRKVLGRSGVQVLVARDPEGAEGLTDLLGFVAVEFGYDIPRREWQNGEWTEQLVSCDEPLIHYVFVKHSFRRFGIAKALFRKAGVKPYGRWNYTCRTPVVSRLKAKISSASWLPMVARHTKTKTKPNEQQIKSTAPEVQNAN